MKALEVARRTKSVATSYGYRFTDYSGWAIFTVNDSTGELSLQSDWGNFSYRWNTGALGKGKTLTTFLAGTNSHYVAEKFGVVSTELDESETRKAIRSALDVRADDVASALLEDAIDDVDDLDFTHVNRLYTSASTSLVEALGCDPPSFDDLVVYRKPPQYLRVRELIDLFIADLKVGAFEEVAS